MNNYRIVVGVDGSPESKKALTWAVTEARARHATIEAVRAWTPGEFGTPADIASFASKSLDEDAREVLGDDSDVTITCSVEEGHPGHVLVGRAKDADMLVVGSRGRGGFAGLLLGSVSQQVVTHAAPTAVVVVKG